MLENSDGSATDFQKLYTPQSEEYLHHYRDVVNELFEGTDQRMGWYDPWQAWIVTSHQLCKTILADERLTPDFMNWKFAPPPTPEEDKNDFEIMLDNSLFRLDRLAHRRVRRLAAKAFSMSQTDKIMAGIVDIVSETFDKVANEEVLTFHPH